MSLLLLSDTHADEIRTCLGNWLASIGDNPSVGYLASSADPTREYFQPIVELYDSLGAQITAFAEPIHGPDCELYDPLFACDIIHLCGGNTFEYLHHLGASGLDARLKAFVAAGGHLVGVSAGAVLMTPDIASATYCGDEPVVPFQVTEGLGLVTFGVIPHVQDKAALAARLQTNEVPLTTALYLMADTDAIEFRDGQLHTTGTPTLIAPE
ncbi:Type 1 glutamine amidotransferase-like domain-containing protein [Shewanella litorisediminis]|uniref:Type 1 glutamine amidotransferase-like domain-containing protein n=1 Tax=Shewanella litorisediminis TaxID=1173586 RepID=A0ABX7G2U9_9GAMM|nr:Type 1 glutamine amidotransferase-like domain-containing protein [Shewanella litorisediminis]MCL2917157.1 Type 1 glutamine amidotransferase-like domain-containing protein [Shewanella litorisediminis]QRH01634.1 Type 1 glutamine amidotransferase-like domain-containing protein [Shewanella litorisediminis]